MVVDDNRGALSIGSKPMSSKEDPYEVLKGGYNVALALSVVGFGISARVMLWVDEVPG